MANPVWMTKDEYRACLAELGLSHRRAGELFGITGRTSQNYVYGECPVPKLVADALRSLLKKARGNGGAL